MKFFSDHGVSISTVPNAKVIKFLDANFDLSKGIYKYFTKEFHYHGYIRKESYSHPEILNNLYTSVQLKISTKSSYKYVFDECNFKYENVLEKSKHKVKLQY